jgi:hypothetical protein
VDAAPRIFEIRGYRVMLDSDLAALYGVPAGTPPSARSRASDPAPLRRGLRTRKRGACLCSSGCHTVLAVKAVCSSRLWRSCLRPSPEAMACVRRALPQGNAPGGRTYPLVGSRTMASGLRSRRADAVTRIACRSRLSRAASVDQDCKPPISAPKVAKSRRCQKRASGAVHTATGSERWSPGEHAMRKQGT